MKQAEPAHTYTNGDVFLLQGQEYRLQVCSRNSAVWVNEETKELWAGTEGKHGSPAEIQKALERFYRKQAEETYPRCVQYWLSILKQKAADSPIKYPGRITIRNQKTRWGSCSSKGNLNFNWRLMMAPVEILVYVVVHELCHLVYMNHSPQFWKLVEEILPGYRKQRQWLKENARLLEWEDVL